MKLKLSRYALTGLALARHDNTAIVEEADENRHPSEDGAGGLLPERVGVAPGEAGEEAVLAAVVSRVLLQHGGRQRTWNYKGGRKALSAFAMVGFKLAKI